MSIVDILIWAITGLFAVAALLALIRVVVGPSILDRVVAVDVLMVEVMCIIGGEMVINRHTDNLTILLIIAAVGVFGSISVARFVARKDNPK